METDVVVRRVSDGLQLTLNRLSSLASVVAAIAAVIGAATFATGWWLFPDNRTAWIIIGGVLCLVPVGAALFARLLLRVTAKHAPQLIGNVRTFLGGATPASRVLIDYDSGQPVITSSRTFTGVRDELATRSAELPALWAGVRAITSVPALAAISVLGMIGVGLMGTILLISGLLK
jgi:hypothetical protein